MGHQRHFDDRLEETAAIGEEAAESLRDKYHAGDDSVEAILSFSDSFSRVLEEMSARGGGGATVLDEDEVTVLMAASELLQMMLWHRAPSRSGLFAHPPRSHYSRGGRLGSHRMHLRMRPGDPRAR
jgi:hypothetical protein